MAEKEKIGIYVEKYSGSEVRIHINKDTWYFIATINGMSIQKNDKNFGYVHSGDRGIKGSEKLITLALELIFEEIKKEILELKIR